MKDIAIYGAGGFGREIACLINKINEVEPTWNLIGFFDDNKDLKGKEISHYGICLGGIDELNGFNTNLAVVICVGSPNVLKIIYSKINNNNIYFPNIIHPETYFSDKETFSIGKGNIIQRNCSFSCDVSLGDFNILNSTVSLGHDAVLGSFNTIMPSVRVSGAVSIGYGNFFGVGSVIIQKIKIGNNVRLGAGSVIMTKPKDNSLYIGNPAKIFKC